MRRAPQWLSGGRSLLTNSTTLVATWGITSGFGAIFWFVAARSFPQSAVGIASAAVSAMTLLATLGTVGFNTLVIGELRRRPTEVRELVSSCLAVTAAVSALLGIAFALVAPDISPQLKPFAQSVGAVALFAAGVSLTAVGMVLDQAFVGLLRGRAQLWRNVLFAILKLALVLLLAVWGSERLGIGIYGTWVVGTLLSLLVMAVPALRRAPRLMAWRPRTRLLRGLGGAALSHHAFNLALKAPSMALPVMVVALLSAELNASFYIASMIAGFLYVIPSSLTTVLYAVCSDATALRRKVRLTLGVSVALCVAGNVVLWVGATPILNVFGSSYAHDAAWSLRILSLVAFPMIVKTHYATIRRITERVAGAIPLVLTGTAVELALAAAGAKVDGINGVSIGWSIALWVEAVVMMPTLLAALGEPGGRPTGGRWLAGLRPRVPAGLQSRSRS